MNRLVLLLAGSVVVFGLVFFMFQDDLVTANSNNSNGNINTTEVEVNLNCPVDASVITNLIEVYADNSCPRITVRRLDLKAPNEVVISPTISWLNNFRASLFPLTKDDLIDDIESFKSKAITPELEKLLSAKQGANASCDYQNIRENFRFRDTDMYANNLTYYVNRLVAEGKTKVVFKILKCPKPPKPGDRDGDGIIDSRDKCIDISGNLEGCPDSDGDGFPDHRDDCPNESGRSNGCPTVNLNLRYEYRTMVAKWNEVPEAHHYRLIVRSKLGTAVKDYMDIKSNYQVLNDLNAKDWNGKGDIYMEIIPMDARGRKIFSNQLRGSRQTVSKVQCSL